MKQIIFSIFGVLLFFSSSFSQVTATVYGDAVSVRDGSFEWNCGGVFFAEVQIVADTVMITEVDTMNLTTCTCPFTVTTLVGGLNAGSYTAKVFRQHRVHLRYPVDTLWVSTVSAGSASFTIAPHPFAAPEVMLHQSGCGVNPGSAPKESPLVPGSVSLSCYPNPFNPGTVMRYTVPVSGRVTLAVYDMNGKCVDILTDEWKESGSFEEVYVLKNVASGPYLCRLTQGKNTIAVKLLLLK
jgi:hypothetical protein